METVKFYFIDKDGYYNIYQFAPYEADLFQEYAQRNFDYWGLCLKFRQWSLKDSNTFLYSLIDKEEDDDGDASD